MKTHLNSHELIEESELSRIDGKIMNKKAMEKTETEYGNSYYYGTSKDKAVPLERLVKDIEKADIHNLYVHVPFCRTACNYCTYPKITGPDEEEVAKFIAELKKEISGHIQLFKFSDLKTIHIGGGTPNFLNSEQLSEVLEAITSEFPMNNLEELAIEVSPVCLNEDKLKLINWYGFNRISIGIQTFDDSINQLNGRKGQKADEAIRLVNAAKRYFPNVSLDLLAGQKGQTEESFYSDFEKALELDVNSVFLYQVRQAFKDGGIQEIKALNYFLNFFSEHGYEILSHNHVIKKRNSDGYCKQRGGRAKLENLLGIGPGAVSEIGEYVFKNIHPAGYLAEDAKIDETSIKLRTDRNLKAMFLIRSLRYFIGPEVNGMLIKDFERRFNSSPYEEFRKEIEFMIDEGLVKMAPEKLEVTQTGILFTQWMDNYLTNHYK